MVERSFEMDMKETARELFHFVESYRRKTSESQMHEALNLCDAVDDFCVEMKIKLLEKMLEGRKGWCTPDGWDSSSVSGALDVIRDRIQDHVGKGDPVDVANFAMFWWNLERKGK